VIGATVVGFAVYFITNPYVLINAIVAPEILRSNLSNSTAMYGKRGLRGIPVALWLIGEGAGPVITVLGLYATVWIALAVAVRRRSMNALATVLAAIAVLLALQFALLAEGKPAEYARFAILIDIALAISLVGVSFSDRNPRVPYHVVRIPLLLGFVGPTALWGFPYVLGFVRDASDRNTRIHAAEVISAAGADIALIAEPAPYSCPPFNLFHRRVVLVDPMAETMLYDWFVRSLDQSGRFFDTPISWANKPFAVQWRGRPSEVTE
jgi:hypothetical protein